MTADAPQEDVPPVVLREPERFRRGTAATVSFDAENLWSEVVSPKERILWQGKSGAILPVALAPNRLLPKLASGVLALLAETHLPPVQPARRYLLTTRSVYIASQREDGSAEVVFYPITAKMVLGLYQESVTFAELPSPDGPPQPVGFFNIPDAPTVYTKLR